MSRRRISWSELPSGLLTSISDLLRTQNDAITFRLVCKAWRDSTSFSTRDKHLNILSPLLPYEFTINEIISDEKIQTSFPLTLVPCAVFIVQSLVDNKLPIWLWDVKEFTPGKFRAREFHPLRVKSSFSGAFFRVSELGRFYTLKWTHNAPFRYMYRLVDSKLVLISKPKFGTLAEIVDYKVIALDNEGNLHIISIKHGIIDRLTSPYTKTYDDVVYFQGSIYAIDCKGRLYCMAYNDTKLKIVVSVSVDECSESDRKKLKNFLVVDMSNDELYLVPGYIKFHGYIKSFFRVYKMNFKSKTWDEVAGIGIDRILVVIRKRCFFTMAKDIPGLSGNCIIFRNEDLHNYVSLNEVIPSMFSFQDGSCKNVSSDNLCHRFWPPPDWVSSDTNLFNRLSIRETMIVRDFCNHVASESSCTKETCVAEVILHMNDELKGMRKIQTVARDHVRMMQTNLSVNDRSSKD